MAEADRCWHHFPSARLMAGVAYTVADRSTNASTPLADLDTHPVRQVNTHQHLLDRGERSSHPQAAEGRTDNSMTFLRVVSKMDNRKVLS